MTESGAECVIVGGGIGGAVLALALGRRGRRVLILERETARPAMTRPEILAGATMDALGILGVRERIEADAAIALEGIELHETGRGLLFHVTADDLREAGARPYSTDPAKTRQIILDAAEATGNVTVEHGVDVRNVRRQDGAVAGVEALRAGEPVSYPALLTVGDDGARSTIREAIGSAIDLQAFPLEFFGAVIPRPTGVIERVGQAWVNLWDLRDGLFAGLFLPIPGDRTALVFAASPRAAERFRQSPHQFQIAASALSPLCWQPGVLPEFPKGFGHFKRPFGHAGHYVADGVALLGDAAHPVTPAGGQGANMAIADAMVLAVVAGDCLRARDVRAMRLYRYEFLRWEANSRSLTFSERPTQVFNVLSELPVLNWLLRAYLRMIDRSPRTKRRLVGGVARAFVSD